MPCTPSGWNTLLEHLDDAVRQKNKLTLHAGFSLIELLVALAIGVVILIAIGSAYVNSTNSLRQREDQAELNDPARIVMRLLRQNLVQAGYVDMFDLDADERARAASLFQPGNAVLNNLFVRIPSAATVTTPLSLLFDGLTPIFGCDGAMSGSPKDIAITAPPATQACGTASTTRHTLQIAYQGVPESTGNPINSLLPANSNTGDGLDCLQQDAPSGAVRPVVINRFSMSDLPTAAGASSELRCAGSGALSPQALAAGVEEFIIRYQMAAPGVAGSQVAAGSSQQAYISATLVSASTQGWAGVTAVEVCMVSATPVARGAAAPGTAALQPSRPTCQRDADGAFLTDIARTAGDTRLWKRFTSVVSLRNAVIATPL